MRIRRRRKVHVRYISSADEFLVTLPDWNDAVHNGGRIKIHCQWMDYDVGYDLHLRQTKSDSLGVRRAFTVRLCHALTTASRKIVHISLNFCQQFNPSIKYFSVIISLAVFLLC